MTWRQWWRGKRCDNSLQFQKLIPRLRK